MPSSKARRRRGQQRRGPGLPASPRRPAPAAAEVEPTPAQEGPVDEAAATAAEEPVESVDQVAPARPDAEADAVDDEEAFDAEDDEADDEDEDEAEFDEDLEEQEEDVEDAQVAIEAASRDGGEPVVLHQRDRREAPERSRSASRNRRRGAAPQPRGPALVRFFRETFDELRKVDWPSPSELYRYTIIVIITVIVLAAFISGIDWALQQLAQKFIYGSSAAPAG